MRTATQTHVMSEHKIVILLTVQQTVYRHDSQPMVMPARDVMI